MTRTSILKFRVISLELIFFSNATEAEEIELQLASKKSEITAPAVELSSSERHLPFVERAIDIMSEKVQNQGAPAFWARSSACSCKMVRTAAKFNYDSLTVSDLSLRDEVKQLTEQIEELRDEVTRAREDANW